MAVNNVGSQPAGPGQAWQALMRHHEIQFAFPDAPPIPATPLWLQRLMDFMHRHSQALNNVGWVLLAVLVLVVGYFLIRHLVRRGWAQAEAPAPHSFPAWQPDVAQARLLLRDADALAAEGRFGEAAHLLLLVCIQEVGDRRPGAVLPAFTSREIAHLEALSPTARRIFSRIALVVERCVFGGRVLGADDFAQARAAFEEFTFPAAWRNAA